MKRSCRRLFVVLILCLFMGPVSVAFGYSTIISFGDSLSDNGNIGRFTDGPLWVELLAGHYSIPLTDIAYGGATTGYDNPAAGLPFTGLQWQVEQFAGGVPGDSLITLWAGANDFLQARDSFNAAVNISVALENLYVAGGRDFLVPNLPNIGSTPAFDIQGSPFTDIATAWTLNFNATLDVMLQNFTAAHSDANLFFLDSFTIFDQYPVGSPEWLNLFWTDGFHPSTAGHQLIYDAALAELETPEPATILLFGTGLAGLVGVNRRRKKSKKQVV